MARVHVVPVKAGRLLGIIALLLGASFASIGVIPFTGRAGALSSMPMFGRLLFIVIGLIGALAGYFRARYGPMMKKAMDRLKGELGVEGDRLVLPRPFRLKPGRLEALLEREIRRGRTYYEPELSIVEGEKPETVKDSLEPGDFPGSGSILVNVDWSYARVGVGPVTVGPTKPIVEWVNLPCYIIREEGYKAPVYEACIALLRKPALPVALKRNTLEVVEGRDMARASLEVVDGAIRGRLEFYKGPESKSRGARLEVKGEYRGVSYTARIAELKEPGSLEFTWPKWPVMEEPVYIIVSDVEAYSPSRLLKPLGITGPVILGEIWKSVENPRIRLVLNRAMARDVVDEEELIVISEPARTGTSQEGPEVKM